MALFFTDFIIAWDYRFVFVFSYYLLSLPKGKLHKARAVVCWTLGLQRSSPLTCEAYEEGEGEGKGRQNVSGGGEGKEEEERRKEREAEEKKEDRGWENG